MNRARTAAVALAAAGILTATAACSGSAQQAATHTTSANQAQRQNQSLPGTPPGVQARWLLGALAHLPIPAAELTAHFDHVFLTKIPPAQLNATLARITNVRLNAVALSTSEFVLLNATVNGQRQTVTVDVDAHGLINGLQLAPAPPQPAPPVPATWAAADEQIEQAAPQVRLLVASVSGGACRPIQAIGATTPAPLGSAFKLYVLDALARAIAAGRVSWNEQVTITSGQKSLPSGELTLEPDGTRLTVLQAAEDMISASDNTAANLLINLAGRTAVEAAAAGTGMADPALDTPFLTTRELFVLKLDDWPSLANRYLALNSAGRLAFLTSTVDHAPLPALTAAASWTAPRDIGSLEWFASPTDICKVYASLAALARQPGLAPVTSILEINDGGLGLDPRQWQSVWFKGGSEPGVVTLNYLATTRSGQTYLVSVLTANPTAPIPAAATAPLLGAIKAAFTLATS
jgi:beta-lactamase class A